MSTLKKLFAPALLGTAMALSAASAFALEQGEAGSYTAMQNKLAAENQTEVLSANAGTEANVLGLKIYYNNVTKVSYIVKTDSPGAPSQMKILVKMTEAKPLNPQVKDIDPSVAFINRAPALLRCDQLVKAGQARAGECNSLNANLETAKGEGKMTFLQGKVGSNIWTAVVNTTTGRGNILESTSEGATFIRLGFSGAEYLPKINSLALNGTLNAPKIP